MRSTSILARHEHRRPTTADFFAWSEAAEDGETGERCSEASTTGAACTFGIGITLVHYWPTDPVLWDKKSRFLSCSGAPP